MPLAAGGGGAACVVVGCGDGFGAGLATFAACPEAVWDGGLAAVAPLLPPPQPAMTSATIGTTAAPAMNLMDLVRIMVLLWLSLYDAAGCDGRGGCRTRLGSSRVRTFACRGRQRNGYPPEIAPLWTPSLASGKPYPRGRVSAETRLSRVGRRPLAWGASPVFPTRVRACRCDDRCAWTGRYSLWMTTPRFASLRGASWPMPGSRSSAKPAPRRRPSAPRTTWSPQPPSSTSICRTETESRSRKSSRPCRGDRALS